MLAANDLVYRRGHWLLKLLKIHSLLIKRKSDITTKLSSRPLTQWVKTKKDDVLRWYVISQYEKKKDLVTDMDLISAIFLSRERVDVILGSTNLVIECLKSIGLIYLKVHVGLVYSNAIARIRPQILFCAHRRPNHGSNTKKHEILPQNVDLPPILPKKKKKPYPIPLKKIQQAARADKKLAQMGIEKPLEPPKNGLLVPDLIPVAYEVLDAWKVLIRGLAQLLHVIPVHACSECSEIHVAQIGHDIQDCRGPTSVELPEYPSRRRTEPIRMLGKKVIDMGGFSDFLPTEPEIPRIAQETVNAYEKVKWGVTKLMRKYSVKACGYCSEMKCFTKLCVACRGSERASIDAALKRFYGKAPAVVELCIQAGARVPDKYRPMMRLDIVVPEDDEARFIA
ncbi:hypothetical protein DH2020_043707 [Rehmannia glutinosa]|uniref:APO domain-containing protein n=1 Tax=Rehmannia glutinosa TaxID=99300 RepID=A0ABR0UKQ6_REHGL